MRDRTGGTASTTACVDRPCRFAFAASPSTVAAFLHVPSTMAGIRFSSTYSMVMRIHAADALAVRSGIFNGSSSHRRS